MNNHHQVFENILYTFFCEPNILLKLLNLYLQDKTFLVKYNGTVSKKYKAHSGVPQGFNLGLLLFLYFINVLPDIICHSRCVFYAGDLKVFKEIITKNKCNLLQDDIM